MGYNYSDPDCALMIAHRSGRSVRFCQLYEVLRSQPPSTHLGHLLMWFAQFELRGFADEGSCVAMTAYA